MIDGPVFTGKTRVFLRKIFNDKNRCLIEDNFPAFLMDATPILTSIWNANFHISDVGYTLIVAGRFIRSVAAAPTFGCVVKWCLFIISEMPAHVQGFARIKDVYIINKTIVEIMVYQYVFAFRRTKTGAVNAAGFLRYYKSRFVATCL